MVNADGCILVTGANGGLGSAVISHIVQDATLASRYVGLYAVRRAAVASQLLSVVQYAPATHRYDILQSDLSSLASIRELASDINGRVALGELPRIRALILCAGYQDFESLTMSTDGFEMTWQVNYLANMVLCLLLLQSLDRRHGRILMIGSWTHE
ncbi:hypothetical protein CDD81_2312 [Ophiocordyceps australis]|uniref:Ketoreductase (KR) domain-containing protein n=1 Tax=Ophiocordyceps australis TaxID=1399860 RepID=A0A2C5YE16_9HYPO|nr:hypothetical protein CDD81_2312 [Ophiocordyceps australis]